MYFSNDSLYHAGFSYINVTPQINDTNVITDTLNWVLIYGEYVAHGGEQYLTIGNFFPDALTDTVHVISSGGGAAYYFIDDVNVHCCTCDNLDHTGVKEVDNKYEIVEIYPNPASSTFTITSTEKIESVKIYNIIGELLFTETPNNIQSTININQFSKGIYFVEIKTEKRIVRKKIVKE
jgi:hypothetical protein